VFEGSSDTVSRWKSLPSFFVRLDVNGAESRMLQSMKQVIQPILTASSRLVQKPHDELNPVDFASIYLNRHWYLLLLDYINSRIEDADKKATIPEVLELQRVWTLQCIYATTAKKLFTDKSQWFSPVRRLNIPYERYSFILGKLGADLPQPNLNVGLNDDEQDQQAEHVWGSFNQHNDVITKIEAHVGNIGTNFY
jgi:hypothetical protein